MSAKFDEEESSHLAPMLKQKSHVSFLIKFLHSFKVVVVEEVEEVVIALVTEDEIDDDDDDVELRVVTKFVVELLVEVIIKV